LILVNGVASGTTAPDLLINGTIQAFGTEALPITITCTDAALNWGQIRHNTAQPSTYRYTFISRAGRATGEGHTGSAPVIRPNEFHTDPRWLHHFGPERGRYEHRQDHDVRR
jgi:hypothetical protein